MSIPFNKPQPFLRFTIIITFLLLVIQPITPVKAEATVFVSPGGSGTDCDQGSPCNLQYALEHAELGDAFYAAAGTYTGTGNEVALIDLPLYFHGGWNGAPTGSPVTDPDLYVSVLDGQNARRVLTIAIDPSLLEQTVVDGWTVRNGNATALADTCEVWAFAGGGCGGGIYIDANNVLIANNIIHSNTAANSESELGGGGGIYVKESSDVTVFGNQIHDNNSNTWGEGWGGGIYFHESGGDCELAENEIYNSDLVVDMDDYHYGSGIMLMMNTAQIEVINNQIHDNGQIDPSYQGSAIGCQYCTNQVTIQSNQLLDNEGDSALMLSYSSPLVQQNTIINPGASAGIFFGSNSTGQALNLFNNIITRHDNYNIYGMMTSMTNTSVTMMQNTLADASIGMRLESSPGLGSFSILFTNGIVSDHSDTGISSAGPLTLIVSDTLFYNNLANGVTGSNPLAGNPNFKSPVNYNYHLNRGSQAIDRIASGLGMDIDGDTRPFGSGDTSFDAGADEFIHSLFFFLPVTMR
jgi:parallel beta-helix repeat protein